MKPITVWDCKNKEGVFEFNHIEDGHVDNNKPIPKFPAQEGWKKKEWHRTYCYLNDKQEVVHDAHLS